MQNKPVEPVQMMNLQTSNLNQYAPDNEMEMSPIASTRQGAQRFFGEAAQEAGTQQQATKTSVSSSIYKLLAN